MFKNLVQKSKRVIFIFAIFLLIAILINIIILEIFNQKNSYRSAHSLIGIIMLMEFFVTFKDDKIQHIKLVSLFFISLIPCYLGTVYSDLDIRLLGIGSHRNPLFHSGLLFFIMVFFMRLFNSILLGTIIAAFGVGLGSHLIWDIFDHADVRWIPGGTLDRLWLGLNGALCLILAKSSLSSQLQKESAK